MILALVLSVFIVLFGFLMFGVTSDDIARGGVLLFCGAALVSVWVWTSLRIWGIV